MACCCLHLGATRYPTDFYVRVESSVSKSAIIELRHARLEETCMQGLREGEGGVSVRVCECCGRHYILLSIISLCLKCHYISSKMRTTWEGSRFGAGSRQPQNVNIKTGNGSRCRTHTHAHTQRVSCACCDYFDSLCVFLLVENIIFSFVFFFYFLLFGNDATNPYA